MFMKHIPAFSSGPCCMALFKALRKDHIDTTYAVNKCVHFLRNVNVLKTHLLHADERFNTAPSPYAAVIHMI